MKPPSRLIRLLACVIWLCAGLCVADTPAAQTDARRLDPVRLQLKWLHQFQFAGFYAALEKGYYREAGIDVRILEASAHESALDVVVRGDAEFGLHSSDLIRARAQGKPLVALAAIFQHSPMVLLSRLDAGIRSLHDLVGKRLLLGPDAAELLAYLKSEKVPTPTDLSVQSFDLKALIDGQVDAMPGYSTDQTYLLHQAGISYNAFTPRSAGIDFYGDILFTTEDQVRHHPERVRRFREASLRGWYYALAHREEIVDLILSKYSQRHSREHLLFEASEIQRMMTPDLVEIGYMHAGRWRHIADTYAELGMMPANYDFDGFIYLPASRPDFSRTLWIAALALLAAALGGMMSWHYRRLNTKLQSEIVERRTVEERLRESEQRFRTLVETSPDGVIMTDRSGAIRYVSLRVLGLFGCNSQADMIGRKYVDLVVPEYRDGVRRYFDDLLREGRSGSHEFMALRRAARPFWMETNGERMLDDAGEVSGVFFISRDISERKRLSAELESMAHTDSLTGLQNRRRFLEQLGLEVRRCVRYTYPMAVMEFDLDHFKSVNDQYGHAAGDQTLTLFASLIRNRLRHSDFACRFGGEEFMVALPETSAAEACMVAERIRHDLEESRIDYESEHFRITVSVGLAEHEAGDTPESLIKRTDEALYRAKQKGRNRVEI